MAALPDDMRRFNFNIAKTTHADLQIAELVLRRPVTSIIRFAILDYLERLLPEEHLRLTNLHQQFSRVRRMKLSNGHPVLVEDARNDHLVQLPPNAHETDLINKSILREEDRKFKAAGGEAEDLALGLVPEHISEPVEGVHVPRALADREGEEQPDGEPIRPSSKEAEVPLSNRLL